MSTARRSPHRRDEREQLRTEPLELHRPDAGHGEQSRRIRRPRLGDRERKAHFFAALWLLQEGLVAPEDFKGSWAGAFGMTQFMPGTYVRHMSDGDGDGGEAEGAQSGFVQAQPLPQPAQAHDDASLDALLAEEMRRMVHEQGSDERDAQCTGVRDILLVGEVSKLTVSNLPVSASTNGVS